MAQLAPLAPTRVAGQIGLPGPGPSRCWWAVSEPSRPSPRVGQARGFPAPIPVLVLASDPVTADATIAYLDTRPGITPVSLNSPSRPQIAVILTANATNATLATMQHLAASPSGPKRFILVTGTTPALPLAAMIAAGLIAIIPRNQATPARIDQAIHAAAHDRIELPAALLTNLLTPPAPRLDQREVDVLRLISEGHDTSHIARDLCYSERTVRNIIHTILNAHKLHNRAHAVAYALRNGFL